MFPIHRLPHYVASASLALSVVTHAQQAPAAPSPAAAPATPKILLAPGGAATVWTVKFTYKKSLEAVAEEKKEDLASKSLELTDLVRPEKVRFVVQSPVSSRIVSIEGGAKEEAYYVGNFEFRLSPASKEVLSTNLDSYPTPDQLFRKRFPGVDWVKPSLFVRVEDAYGEPCAFFRNGNPEKVDPNKEKMDDVIDNSKYFVREAWFSMKTGLPVAYKHGDVEAKITFEPATGEKVQIPEKIRESIARQAKYEAYLKQRATPTSAAN